LAAEEELEIAMAQGTQGDGPLRQACLSCSRFFKRVGVFLFDHSLFRRWSLFLELFHIFDVTARDGANQHECGGGNARLHRVYSLDEFPQPARVTDLQLPARSDPRYSYDGFAKR